MIRRALALSLVALSACAASSVRPPAPPPAPATLAAPPPAAAPAASGPGAAAPAPAVEGAPGEEPNAIDDDDDEQGPSSSAPASSPVLALSDAEIDRAFHHDVTSLGPASVGAASGGVLVNGVQMPANEEWRLQDPPRAWGTQETVDALVHCIDRVNQRHPGAPPITIGHLSARTGGHLSPHRSHQSGRDADVGYYYRSGPRSFVHATQDNLDLPRTWELVKTALKETTVEMILIDGQVQRVLAAYAAANGEDPAFLDEVFQVRGKNARAPIRHVHGHDNHIHFRFHNPIAEELGKRVARFVTIPRAPAPVRVAASQAEAAGYAPIRARNGDTLVILAKRYGTTVEEIQRANRLAGNAIRAGVIYRIPQKVAPKPLAKAAPRKVGHDGAAGGPKPRSGEAAPGHDGAAGGPKPRSGEAAPGHDGAAGGPKPRSGEAAPNH